MKRLLLFLGLLQLALPGGSCARNNERKTNLIETQEMNEMKTDRKVLVVFFSHTGENYAVGDITKGNTHIVAEMIAELTNGRLFEIVPEKDYPHAYNDCIAVAKREKEAAARPAVKGDIAVEEYDVVFIGYPNWWGDMPMPVYTFIEKHDWAGKTVIPFCTHEGSGLSATERSIAEACRGAETGKGLAVRGATAQNSPEQAKRSVQTWLERLGY